MTAKGKPGPKVFVPTTEQRHEVELMISVGMGLETIAGSLDISRRTLCRSFPRELATGRAKSLRASVSRLDRLAEGGNVAACKYLHSLMDRRPIDSVEDDKWSAIANKIEADLDEQANSPKNGGFWKNN
jgi:hypothetical protein